MNLKKPILVVAALALLGSGPAAFAKPTKRAPVSTPQSQVIEDASEPEAAPQPARVCPKMCETDMSPCDPPFMKNADARCSNPGTTIGF